MLVSDISPEAIFVTFVPPIFIPPPEMTSVWLPPEPSVPVSVNWSPSILTLFVPVPATVRPVSSAVTLFAMFRLSFAVISSAVTLSNVGSGDTLSV